MVALMNENFGYFNLFPAQEYSKFIARPPYYQTRPLYIKISIPAYHHTTRIPDKNTNRSQDRNITTCVDQKTTRLPDHLTTQPLNRQTTTHQYHQTTAPTDFRYQLPLTSLVPWLSSCHAGQAWRRRQLLAAAPPPQTGSGRRSPSRSSRSRGGESKNIRWEN